MPVIQLTVQFVKHHLVCPDDKARIEYCDQTIPGLYIEVRHTTPNLGTYYFRYKNAGKNSHQRIGRTTEINLPAARDAARKLKMEIAAGNDPKIGSPLKPDAMTFKTFMEEKYLPYAEVHKRSSNQDRSLSLRLLKIWGNFSLNQLTRQEIQSFHTDLYESGLAPATCDHYLKLMRHCLNLAVDWELIEKNPAKRIRLFHVDNRVERLLSDRELKELLHVLKTDENKMVCMIALFLLSTGARLNEALLGQWHHISLANKTWRIPASNSKSKRIRSVPLNNSAIKILQQLGTEGKSEYLFVSSTTGKRMKYIHKVWSRIRKKAGLPNLRLHDLRHQYASFLVNSGRSLYEVQQILGHSSPTITQRYAHLSTRSLQNAADAASLQIDELGEEPALE